MKRVLVCALTVLLVCGCGGGGSGLQVEFVEGVVTLDGNPLAGASVMFMPADTSGGTEAASGTSDGSGRYMLSSMNGDPGKGAVMGNYVVTVSKIESNDPRARMSSEEAMASDLPPTQKELLPAVYQNSARTPLKATVNKGRNKIDIELKSNP